MIITYAEMSGAISYGIVIRMSDGYFWNTDTQVFEPYGALHEDLAIMGAEHGTSGLFALTFPAVIAVGGYKVFIKRRVGATPASSDPVVWEEVIWWNGTTSVSSPPPPSASPDLVTGYLYTYDPAGGVESGVLINSQAVRFVEDEELGELSGVAVDDTVRTITSDVNGLAEFPGLFKGVVYSFWRGTSGTKYNMEIPLDEPNDPVAIPAIIGRP